MTGPVPASSDAPLTSRRQLLDHILGGSRPPEAWGIGLEYERLGVDRETGRAVPYSGPRGVEAVLRALVARHGWSPEEDRGRVIGLARGGARIALEPGGQLELSGSIHRDLRSLRDEVVRHLREVEDVSGPLGIAWLPLGLQPLSAMTEIEWVPKARYEFMAPFLGARGALAHHMMKGTAGVQVNLDYEDEADGMAKMRTAMAAGSIATAIFANSPLEGGRLTGDMTRRARVWTATDPARCGLVAPMLADGTGFDDWVEYALDVPMLFVQRRDRLIPMDGITFRRFLADGHGALRATASDWTLHLTTIFTEVRLKTYVEVRGADSVGAAMTCSLAAFWKGLLYDRAACADAWRILSGPSFEERNDFHLEICALGPRARLAGRPAAEIAADLLDLAGEGLARQGEDPRELQPLRDSVLDEGSCPAARLARRWSGRADAGVRRLAAEALEADASFLTAGGPPPSGPDREGRT